jgi:hypothetical protein
VRHHRVTPRHHRVTTEINRPLDPHWETHAPPSKYGRYEAVLAELRKAYPLFPLFVFTSAPPEPQTDNLATFRSYGARIVTQQECGIAETFAVFANAPVLIMGRSSFSYVGEVHPAIRRGLLIQRRALPFQQVRARAAARPADGAPYHPVPKVRPWEGTRRVALLGPRRHLHADSWGRQVSY